MSKFQKFFNDELDENEVGKDPKNEANRNNQIISEIPTNKFNTINSNEEKYRETSYRFIAYGLFIGSSFVGALCNFTFGPILSSMKKTTDIKEIEIFYITIIMRILDTFVNTPLIYVNEKLGNRKSVLIGTGLLLAGSVIRVFFFVDIAPLLIGQTLVGLGLQFYQSLISKVVCLWLRPSHRIQAISLNSASYSVGFLLCNFLAFNIVEDNLADKDIIIRQIIIYLATFVIFSGVLFILNIYLYADQPEVPVTPASLVPTTEFWASFKILFSNTQYIALIMGTALVTATGHLKMGYLYYLVKPYGFSQESQNILGSYNSFGGAFGRILIGFAGGLYFQPYKLMKLIPVLCFISGLLFWLSISLKSMVFSCITCFLWGMFADSHACLVEEIAVRLTFPVDEIHSVGNLFTIGSLLTTIMGFTLSKVYETPEVYWAPFSFGTIGLGYLLAFCLFLCVKEANHREFFEKNPPAKNSIHN